jgi:hypothetical protein
MLETCCPPGAPYSAAHGAHVDARHAGLLTVGRKARRQPYVWASVFRPTNLSDCRRLSERGHGALTSAQLRQFVSTIYFTNVLFSDKLFLSESVTPNK